MAALFEPNPAFLEALALEYPYHAAVLKRASAESVLLELLVIFDVLREKRTLFKNTVFERKALTTDIEDRRAEGNACADKSAVAERERDAPLDRVNSVGFGGFLGPRGFERVGVLLGSEEVAVAAGEGGVLAGEVNEIVVEC